MVRWFIAGVGLALLGMASYTGSKSVVAQEKPAAEEKVDPIEGIMKRLHKGKKPVHKLLDKALDEGVESVNWEEVQGLSKDYVQMTNELVLTKPEKGTQASWQKLTKDYAAAAKGLDAAATKKDRKGAMEAFTTLDTSCKDCHKAHKN